MGLTTMTRSVSENDFSVIYVETLRSENHKLRVEIKSDSYADQSYAHVSIFSPAELKWNYLASVLYGLMKTPARLIHQRDKRGLEPAWFSADRDELLRQACEILDV